MIKYFGISMGVHAVALVAAVSIATFPHLGLEDVPSGGVLTVRYLGPAQSVSEVQEKWSAPAEPNHGPQQVAERETAHPAAREENPTSDSSGKVGDGGQTNPVVGLRCPVPPYPRTAKRARAEGTVQLWVTIDEFGRVREAKVKRSSGRDDFDRVAQKTIENSWRYRPATRWGEPVTSREVVEIRFRLD